MKKCICIIFTFLTLLLHSQISPSGCYISGGMSNGNVNGCGNTPNPCNLAASGYSLFGATNCGGTVTSSGGSASNVVTTYNIPAGCTATVVAEMMPRPTIHPTGCNNSGADGGDYVQITNTGGVVSSQSGTICCSGGACGTYPSLPGTPSVVASSSAWTTGCSNATMRVRMVITGGQVTITGRSDRGDEMTTFTLNFSGSCGPGCDLVLPITLSDFYAINTNEGVALKWFVENEIDVSHYFIERSFDTENWANVKQIESIAASAGNKSLTYQVLDNSPVKGNNYYRLVTVNLDGTRELSKIISVFYQNSFKDEFRLSQTEKEIIISIGNPTIKELVITSTQGTIVKRIHKVSANVIVLSKEEFAAGLYLIWSPHHMETSPKKLVVQK